MIQLVDQKEVYDVAYEDDVVFKLRKLSAGEVNKIDDQITVSRKDDTFAYLGGTSARMKVNFALVGWTGVVDSNKNEVPCNDANKELLPSKVQQFLVAKIDIDNGLKKTKDGEQAEKN